MRAEQEKAGQAEKQWQGRLGEVQGEWQAKLAQGQVQWEKDRAAAEQAWREAKSQAEQQWKQQLDSIQHTHRSISVFLIISCLIVWFVTFPEVCCSSGCTVCLSSHSDVFASFVSVIKSVLAFLCFASFVVVKFV